MSTTCHLFFNHIKFASTLSVLFLLGNTLVVGQSKLMDDWKEELSKANGQERIDLIVQLSRDLIPEDLMAAESVATEGIELARHMGDSLSMYRIEANLGRLYYVLNKKEKGFEWTLKSYEYFSRDPNMAFDKARVQLSLAKLFMNKREYEKADSLISDSEHFFKASNDSLWQSKVLHTKGLRHFYGREYEKAMDYFYQSLEINKHLNDTDFTAGTIANISAIKKRQGLYPEALEMQLEVLSMDCSNLSKAKCYSLIGEIYLELEDWEPSKKYINMAIESQEKIGYESGINFCLYNLGVIHVRQKNFGEALSCYEKSLAIQKKYDLDISSTLGTIGTIHNMLGQHEKANEYYDQQMELAVASDNWEGMYQVNYNKGFTHYSAGQYKEALGYALESHRIAEEKRFLQFLVGSNELLYEVYKALGEKGKSTYHGEQFQFFEDSLKSLRRLKKIGALEQEQLAEAKNDNLNTSSQNDAAAMPGETFFNKWKIIIGLGLSALILFVAFWFFKKEPGKQVAVQDVKPLESTKIDQYFEELFTRLDERETVSESDEINSIHPDVEPVNDMAEFLKENLSATDDWASFEKYFEKVHKDFFKNLKSTYPNISINELNMCALLKLNLRNKDIAQIMGISYDSVRKAQSRLSKKLDIPENESLRDFVLKV